MSLFRVFEQSVSRFPHRPFLSCGAQSWTYLDMWKLVNETKKKQIGLGRYHRWMHRGYNSPFFVSELLSTWSLGATFVPLSPHLPKETQKLLTFIVKPFGSPHVVARPPVHQDETYRTENDIALILFTSGTTSLPKPVLLTHENIWCNLQMIQQRIPSHVIDETDSSLAFLPWFHSYGLVCELLFMMTRGGHINIAPSPSTLMRDIRAMNPSLLFTIPRFLDKVQKGNDRSLWFLPRFLQKRLLFGNRLKRLCVGGAKINSETLAYFHSQWDLPVHQGYGCTEASPMISLSSVDETHHFTSCGQLLDGVDAYINETNQLCVHGKNITPGYLTDNNSIARPKSHFLSDGYFNTQDTCTLDENRHLTFLFRDASQWKLQNGKFVDPEHIESAVSNLSCIQQCAVIGNNESHLQMCVVLSEKISEQKLHDDIQKLLQDKGFAHHDIPRRLHILSKPLSVEDGTLSLKQEPLRSVLHKMYFHHEG